MSERLSVCVHGASGYTGAECLRWVLNHPRLRLVGATAQKAAGKPLASLWPRLGGATDVVCSAEPTPADAHLLCLPHGQAVGLAGQLEGLVVDLSGDHRLPEPEHSAAYGFARDTDPWLYGLPELGHGRYAGVGRVANPGCFASAISLALLPAAARLGARVLVTGLTGSTGSGATPSEGTHHPLRDGNLKPYKVLGHQHVPEVERALGQGGAAVQVDFVPISAPLRRGILVSAQVADAGWELWEAFYEGNPLVSVQRAPPELRAVVNTPLTRIGVVPDKHGGVVVIAVIDNLGRGAATQAISNLNLMCGWPVDLGLGAVGPLV